MPIICPTITAADAHSYRHQIEQVEPFSSRIHIDLSDGKFAPKLIDIKDVWWAQNMKADIHLMYEDPTNYLDSLIALEPRMVIFQAEAQGKFYELAQALHENKILVGVSLLPETEVEAIKPAIGHIDHVLIFSGNLGHFGGKADLGLTRKAHEARELKHDLEIGWDGGINEDNAEHLVSAGIDVLDVGGFIHLAENPYHAYVKLNILIRDEK